MLSVLNQIWYFPTEDISNNKIYDNPRNGSRAATRGQTERHEEATSRFSLFVQTHL
jgi:hypothetical protein